MKWLGALLVSPLWGSLSAQLFLQSWLAFANFFIALLGFVKGGLPRRDAALLMGVSLFSCALFSSILRGGHWLLTTTFHFGQSNTETIVYWIFVALSGLYMLPQIPSKIKKSWRNAMVPGSLEEDILLRKMGRIG